MRPIVAGPSCPTHRLSNLIDMLLKPLLKHVRSYIRDSVDFLNHLPKNVDQGSYFVTFDVKSLYTNINHDIGLEAISYWLDNFPDDLHPRFHKNFILEGIKLILTNNIFEFNREYYKQIKGTAMGTKMAPTYANLTLGYLERKLYSELEKKSANLSSYVKENWWRYLDDCFIIWNDKLSDISFLTDVLQILKQSIVFKIEKDEHEISFLDYQNIQNKGKYHCN